MPDSPDRLGDLRQLLKECSAQLTAAGGARGSGVFVDESHVLTCAHVVKGPVGAEVTVEPYNRAGRPGTVVAFEDGADVDLALVEVTRVPGEPQQPAAVVDVHLEDNVPYYAVGWPKGDLAGIEGLEELLYNGHGKGDDALLVLDAGQANVTEGLSGGPVLSSVTGAVVALVQYSRNRNVPMGGGAIPVARAAKLFETVGTYVENPPLSTRRWKDLLGPDGWSALGKPATWAVSVNVIVDGDRTAWTVRIDGEQPVKVPSLPERVSDALFYWAQRRQVYTREDVRLLGQLLSGAVFPDSIAESIEHNRCADSLLLRLTVDNDELFDVPWEFVTLRSNDEMHVAAAEGLSFVRVAHHPSPAEVDTLPRRPEDGDARVVAIVVQPEAWDWQTKMKQYVRGDYAGWPARGDVVKQLRAAVEGAHSVSFAPAENPVPLENPSPADVDRELARARPEVVHYTGFGKFDREAKLALSDGDRGVVWTAAHEFFDWVASARARVLVVELLPQPLGETWEQLGPSAFKAALGGRVNAVVLTRFPMLLGHLRDFNKAFYGALGAGLSVEAAVQSARKDVQSNAQYGDAGAFGSFTLITGERADLRLVQAVLSAPTDLTTKQQRADAGPSRPGPSESSQDNFVIAK